MWSLPLDPTHTWHYACAHMDTPARQPVKAGFPVPGHSGRIQAVEDYELPLVPTMAVVFPTLG